MMVQDPFYIDFSKQLDNEIWYTTFDNNPIKNVNNFSETKFFVGGWGKQSDLQFVKHTYESGLGKITYNKPIIRLGESALITNNVSTISFPKQFNQLLAYCLNNSLHYYKQIIGIFNITNNIIDISQHSPSFYMVYVMSNVTFNNSIPTRIIYR